MYLAVLAVITGQALLLSRPILLGNAAAVIAFGYGYEQLTLARRYGAPYPRPQAGRVPLVAPPATRP
jgi:hypothetical protein